MAGFSHEFYCPADGAWRELRSDNRDVMAIGICPKCGRTCSSKRIEPAEDAPNPALKARADDGVRAWCGVGPDGKLLVESLALDQLKAANALSRTLDMNWLEIVQQGYAIVPIVISRIF